MNTSWSCAPKEKKPRLQREETVIFPTFEERTEAAFSDVGGEQRWYHDRFVLVITDKDFFYRKRRLTWEFMKNYRREDSSPR